MSWKNIQKPDEAWREFATQIASQQGRCNVRTLILAAHPDDEVLGSCAALIRSNTVTVAYLTDGAPRDVKLRPSRPDLSRSQYAQLRSKEAGAALALSRAAVAMHSLGSIDQESVYEIPVLVERFAALLLQVCPDVVITHPYEGGHPDHDTAALVASSLPQILSSQGCNPLFLEMTSYHASDSALSTGVFLPVAHSSPELEIYLSRDERATKLKMLKCYESQKEVIAGFRLQPERLRPAPHYDFSQPPHSGKLWYECMRWPLTGCQWRKIAASALGTLRSGNRLCA